MLLANAIWHMQYPSFILPMLKILHEADIGDRLERDYSVRNMMEYIENTPFEFRKDKQLAIFLIGPSGSGKRPLLTILNRNYVNVGCNTLNEIRC
ncbi:hypothetical protein CDAR_445091 [Caerostris darwini]|uniref:Uncharacterized protein n=1 Tax=Caerostris darwini TaxID=1538125 RepID=A0AAV4R0A2_9ARAC|nr:hypothetical protein CDAR_445091 [Caerostris darwini]